ncbi:MAG TPA: hypothetical protein VF506_04495, partial [Streptosporangiaceae bacterium]
TSLAVINAPARTLASATKTGTVRLVAEYRAVLPRMPAPTNATASAIIPGRRRRGSLAKAMG